jgi:uncharacterized protein (DUF433 family)
MTPLDRITVDPQVMGGRPCVRGLRITAGLVVNLVANGMATAEILAEYPALEEEDIRQCLHYEPQPAAATPTSR